MKSSMRGIASSLRGLKLLSNINPSRVQISRINNVAVYGQFLPYSVSCHDRANGTELRDTFSSAGWAAALTESRKILSMDSSTLENRTRLALSIPMKDVLGRLQRSRNANTHLVNTFKHLHNSDDDNIILWPGMVILLLTKAMSNPFASDNFISKGLEDIIWKSQVELADIINTLHRSFIFIRECHRCTISQGTNANTPKNDISQLVSNYFHSSALYRIGALENYKVAWMIASVLESLAEAKLTKNTTSAQSQLVRTLDDWEHKSFHPRGLLLANGCQASMELGGHGQTLQKVGHQFGKYLVLAVKAHADIQQFVRYQKSMSSCFELGSLPVVLHLQNNPETLAYIYSCTDTLDNLDYFVLYSAVVSSTGLSESRELLHLYITKMIKILEKFDQTPAISNLMRLVEALKYIELYSFSTNPSSRNV